MEPPVNWPPAPADIMTSPPVPPSACAVPDSNKTFPPFIDFPVVAPAFKTTSPPPFPPVSTERTMLPTLPLVAPPV